MPSDRVRRLSAWAQHLLGPKLPLPPPVRRLIVCAICEAGTAVLVDCEMRDDETWWIELRCGECGARRELIASNDETACLRRELDEDFRLIAAEVERLECERMADEVRILSIALEQDLIDASDFERGAR